MSHLAPHRAATMPRIVVATIALCLGIEALLTLADMNILGLGWLRRWAYERGAFWPALLAGWREIFPGQKLTMFFSYAFLHGGLMHAVFNLLVIAHLGRHAVYRLGNWGYVALFFVTAIGGALAFWPLTNSLGPMVGASGVVFGLLGADMWWELQRRRAIHAPLDQLWRTGLGLVLLNVILYFLVDGALAWQAHLGGFIAGFLFARIVTPTLGESTAAQGSSGSPRGFH